jgi:1-deoxy-D-xylulose-5-phosphate synthase
VEDGIISGGISEYLSCLCAKNGITNFCVKAFSEKFYPNGTRAQICKLAQLSPEDIKKSALSLLKK